MMTALVLITAIATPAMAQQNVPDQEIVGVWYTYMLQFDGEEPLSIKDTNFSSLKVYRANGEYACAIMYLSADGKEITVQPHEYGTYSLKNGMYIEMGRTPAQPFNWTSATSFSGRFQKRTENWKKIKDCPKDLEQYIIDVCKLRKPSDNIEKMIKTDVFGVGK